MRTQAVWLIDGYEPTQAATGVFEAAQSGTIPYPMLPYMGLMHTALGNELADFMQGKESAEQALLDVEAAYTAAAQGKGLSPVSTCREGAVTPPPTLSGFGYKTHETPHLFLVLLADRPCDAAVHRAAYSFGRDAVAFHRARGCLSSAVENCGPFGCNEETTIDQEATRALRDAEPLGRFVGLDIYLNRGHLAVAEVAEVWRIADSLGAFFQRLGNLPFYRAMAFTLTYTFITVPLLIGLGLMIALAVNSLHRHLKGLVIFFSLLPMIVTPVVGALIMFWMIDSRGIIGNLIIYLSGDPQLSLKASTPLMWISLIIYGIWHSAPFAFVVFYAGLQTLPQDQLEARRSMAQRACSSCGLSPSRT